MKNGPQVSRRHAEESAAEASDLIAIQALTFLGNDPDRLERFVAVSGLSATSLRQAAADPAFLNGVLDYVLSDETLLLAFAEAQRLDPEEIVRARDGLHRR